MPRGSWTKKDERKYEKILDSCKLERRKGKKRSVATCKRIAAATVNRDRKVRLRGTKGGMLQGPRGLRGITAGHLKHLERMFRDHRTGKIDDARLQAEVWLAQDSGATRDQVQQIRERLNYYPRSGASRFQGLRGTPEEHRARSEAFQDLLAFYAGRVPESLERQLQALGDENWQWATGAARDPENLEHWEYVLDRSLSPGEQRTSRMLQGLRGLRGKTDDGEMWRKAAELWRDYYREHQPMTPAERRAFLAEKRAWLHSQEARDMGEASPGYGWSYNDEDD